MIIKSVLAEIEKNRPQEKKVNSALKKCLKKLSFKSSADLNNLKTLGYWLYVYDYNDLALSACSIIDEVEFLGDFNIWSPIENILLLKLRMLREKGDPSLSKVLQEKILRPNIPHEEALRRRLSFKWLKDATIERYLKAGNLKVANEIRFADLSSLFLIRELGEGKKDIDDVLVDTTAAEKRILEYKQILKSVK